MEPKQAPQTCRWAGQTLFLPLPYWLEAWDSPWSCQRDEAPRAIALTEECRECPRWEPRRIGRAD